MAQTNFTPILTYKSDTASAVPSAGNLTNSANGAELAVNTADKRLFTKDSGGSVVEIGTNPSSLTLPNGTANGVVYANASKVLTSGSALQFDGTNLGLGVTPSAWTNGLKAIEVGNLGSSVYSGGQADMNMTSNAYFNSGWKYGGTGGASKISLSGNTFTFSIAPSGTAGNAISFTQAMTLDASGNLAVGTTSAVAKLSVSGVTSGLVGQFIGTSGAGTLLSLDQPSVANWRIGQPAGVDALAFYGFGSGTYPERARIDSSGNLLVGTTSQMNSEKFGVLASNAAYTTTFRNSNATPNGSYINYSGASPNNTANEFIYASDTTTLRFSVRSNGGIANYSANNVNLSDRREKTNFSPAKSYLDVICAIPVQTYNYIDQNMENDPGLTLGVVAQDVQAIAPELVTESNWGTEKEPKMRLSIYQTDLQYALMKCIQEQQTQISDQLVTIGSLKARLDALEAA